MTMSRPDVDVLHTDNDPTAPAEGRMPAYLIPSYTTCPDGDLPCDALRRAAVGSDAEMISPPSWSGVALPRGQRYNAICMTSTPSDKDTMHDNGINR